MTDTSAFDYCIKFEVPSSFLFSFLQNMHQNTIIPKFVVTWNTVGGLTGCNCTFNLFLKFISLQKYANFSEDLDLQRIAQSFWDIPKMYNILSKMRFWQKIHKLFSAENILNFFRIYIRVLKIDFKSEHKIHAFKIFLYGVCMGMILSKHSGFMIYLGYRKIPKKIGHPKNLP